MLLLGTTALAGTLVGCSGQTIDVIATVAQLIQKVQAGVAAACATLGKWVPTVDTVFAVVSTLLGATLAMANLDKALAFVQQAIDTIAQQCPAPAPTGPLTATVNGKSVPIAFY